MNGLTRGMKVLSWLFQLIAAFILARAAYGKFVGGEMNVAVFEQLGMGNAGMYLIGVIEVFAVLLLVSPNLPQIGAFLGFGTMLGAAIAHVTVLGLGPGDGIMVGMLALVVLSTVAVMFIRRRSMPLIRHTYED